MSELIEAMSEQAIQQALGAGPRKPILCQIIRSAGRMLAETEGFDFVAQLHAVEVRRNVEAKNRLGVRPGRGGR